MLISNLNIQKKLLNQEFTSKSIKTAKIFADSLDKAFFAFGETIQNGLVAEAKKQNLPINFKFPYYSLVYQSIISFAGENVGKKILQKINEELTKQTNITGSILNILNEISKRETLDQIDRFSGHEHVLYLWEREDVRDEVLTHFFNKAKGSKGAISSEKFPIPNIKNISYEKIFEDKLNAVNKNRESILKIYDSNNHEENTRIAGADGTNWFDQGLGNEIIRMEKEFEDYISKNSMSAICAYDLKKIPDQDTLKTFFECHEFVLLDDPFVIYERGN